MTTLELFIVLLALAFIGGMRASRDSDSIWGLASGVEYVVLGVVLGPHLLGLVTRTSVDEFEALWLMGLGWLLAVRGANFGTAPGVTKVWGPLFTSGLSTALCFGAVFASVWFSARYLKLPGAFSLALGLSAVCAESSRGRNLIAEAEDHPDDSHLTRWTLGTELVPILALACLSLGPAAVPLALPPAIIALILSITLGFVLGAIVTALVSAHFEVGELWPLLLGSVLLVVGTALRLNLPAVSPAFILGLTIGALSRHQRELRTLMNNTERQLLLPCLLLAGVILEWPQSARHWLIIGAALLTRWIFKLVWGFVFGFGKSARERFTLGRGLLRGSGVSIAIGLVVFLRQADTLGRSVLMTAVLCVLVGEILSPRQKRAKLEDLPPPSESLPARLSTMDSGAAPFEEAR